MDETKGSGREAAGMRETPASRCLPPGLAGRASPADRYTPEQRAAIAAGDEHVLVAAGAGTGKTHTVVGALLHRLGVPVLGARCADPLRLRDVAAVTFTNQAAADLVRRLRAALRGAGRRDLADEVDQARVGTIHAFCAGVLRELALRGAQPLEAAVLDEGEARALRDDAAAEALLAAVEAGELAGLEALLADHGLRSVERWVARLAGDEDRLRRLLETYDDCDARERALLRLADDARQRVAERLAARGALDFDRIVVATRDLLRDDLAARRALQRRLRLLVVDEFQDVDPVQRELAYLIGEVETGDPHGARLLLVGDPKQSIYRFRRADVSVWREVEHDFAGRGRGRVVVLRDSFRSVPAVLALVEHAVGTALDAAALPDAGRQPFEVDFAPVRATRRDAPPHAGVELLVVPPRADGRARGDEARLLEAAWVAERMRRLHDDEGVRWGDMALLLAAWSALDVYRGALVAAGIPAFALRSQGFDERREVLDLLLALRVAADPRDDLALVGVLRSPFVGVTDETLLAIAHRCRRPYWEHLDDVELADDGERALLQRGRRTIERLAALRDRVPASELLDGLLLDTGYLAHLALLGDEGRQGVANVRQLMAWLRRRPGATVGELLREVDERRRRGDRVAQARIHGERDDVVTVASVHGAKGLEWSVVFWCDLMRAPRAETERLLVGRDRLCLGDPDASPDEQPERWRALSAELAAETAAEARRLWYVAATRARDRLVLAGIAPGKYARWKGTPAEMLAARWPQLGEATACDVEIVGQGARFTAPVAVAAADPALAASGAERSTT